MSLLLDRFQEIWSVDFEFCEQDGERPEPVCCVAMELRSGRKLRLWRDELPVKAPYSLEQDSLFVAFSSPAEFSCHLVLGWGQPAAILDLYVEQRWLTNGKENPETVSLLRTLDYHGLKSRVSTEEKDRMRALILRGRPWTRDEQNDILAYCETDVVSTAELFAKMLPSLDLPRALLRGRYMYALARLRHVGVPVDVDLLFRMRERWPFIKQGLIEQIDPAYGVYVDGAFSERRFAAYLQRNTIPWPSLESGALALSDKTFERMAHRYPQLHDLRVLRDTLEKLSLSEFSISKDGRNRGWFRPFWTVTGRNTPSSAEHVFAATSWVRSLVKPEPGFGVCYLDWVQQEFGIAASLSQDPAMMAAYQSGDSYLWFAKAANMVPKHATKTSHELERELAKQCTLGTQYEITEHGLAPRIQKPVEVARNLLWLHKETFPAYWQWLDEAKSFTFLHGKQITVYGWQRLLTELSCNHRSVGNFFSQGNGAEMLRLAIIFGTEAGVPIVMPMHDAVLIVSPVDRLARDIEVMKECMHQASELVLDGFRLRVEEKTFRYPDRYMCKKGEAFWEKVLKFL
jgi:hypothetical protein